MEQMGKALRDVLANTPFLSRRGIEPASFDPDADLSQCVAEFSRAVDFLCLAPKRRAVNRDFDSYGLKHGAEDWAGGYVSNGALIAGALYLGLIVEPIDGSLNARINIGARTKWPKRAEV